MLQLFLRHSAKNYLGARLGDQNFRARSADRDAETDRLRVGSIMTAIEAALSAAENEHSGLNRRGGEGRGPAPGTGCNRNGAYMARGTPRPRPHDPVRCPRFDRDTRRKENLAPA